MSFIKKTTLEKFETKVTKLLQTDKRFKNVKNKVKFNSHVLFQYSKSSVKYGYKRCYITKVDPIGQDAFTVTIPLTDLNLTLFSSNITNPPTATRYIVPLFENSLNKTFSCIIIGAEENKISGTTIHITADLYKTISGISKEEGKDKVVRFTNRAIPFLTSNYKVKITAKESDRDYTLLLKELIASGNINQEDIVALTGKLKTGSVSDTIIKQQVHKQVKWLIKNMQDIIDTEVINKAVAKDLGNKHFGFLKTDISGPEQLMEMILTKYGQYTIFGAPVLLNTDKYVINAQGLSRSQFDILLITHLSDLEVVELKRPDAIILDYDAGRNKFYASKDLSVAISQAERYISAVYRDNDEDYKIDNLKIREYINREIAGSMTVEIARPTALIVIGRYQSIAPDYESLPANIKKRTTKDNYNKNSLQAYKEIKGALKNINITSYSELIESARTRMILNKEENKEAIKTKPKK